MWLNLSFCPLNAPIKINTLFHLSTSIRLILGYTSGFFLSLLGLSVFLALSTFLTVLRKDIFCECADVLLFIDEFSVSFILT